MWLFQLEQQVSYRKTELGPATILLDLQERFYDLHNQQPKIKNTSH